MQIIIGFWVYAGILEYLQHFSPGRYPSIVSFIGSALGTLCGGLAVALIWRRRLYQSGYRAWGRDR
jgi:VanZ family protein